MSDTAPPPPPVAPETGGASTPSPDPAPNRRISPLAILPLVFGAVAFLVSVIPATAGGTWIFAAAGVVLGIIGLVKRARPRWMPPVGLALAAVGWLISIIVVLSGVGAAVSSLRQPAAVPSASASPSAAEESAAPAAPSEEPDERATVGQTVTNNKKIGFTVRSIQCGIATAGPQYLEETAKGQFCEVEYTVTNGSADKITLFASDITGRIGESTYDADTKITTFGEDYFSTDVNPGLSGEVDAFIDIPAGATLDSVVYKPQFGLFTNPVEVRIG